jgi:anti-anti-sigma regulatory factor
VFIKKAQLIVQQTTFSFKSSGPEAVELLQRQLLDAIASGEKFVRVDVDPLPALDHAGLRALIRMLRHVRRGGGQIVLRVSRPEFRHTLNVLALDKVFGTE